MDEQQVNVLLVDDRPENLVALKAILEKDELNIVLAHSGLDALKYLLSMDFAVILMDVQMPTIDGFETAAMIKEREKSRHIPIIFVTAIHYSDVYVFKGYSLGAVDYLFKPIIPEILRAKVQNFVDLFRSHKAIEAQAKQIASVNSELEYQLRQVRLLNRELETAHAALEEANRTLEVHVLERTAQLENANKELEAFNYSVSHDLRAPLRVINGFSLLLLERYTHLFDEDGLSLLKQIYENTLHMSRIIDSLLAFSRASRHELRLQEIDLSAMSWRIIEQLQIGEPLRQVEFNVTPGIVAVCDGSLLEIALTNLLSNAWKFTAKRDPAIIEFGCWTENDQTVYYVRDNGVGFHMEDGHRLFTPFQRLHKTSEYPGTGVGLATVKRIINRHGGRIWVESEPDIGTTFYFVLISSASN